LLTVSMEQGFNENNARNDAVDEGENDPLYPFGTPVSICSNSVQM
ncbi:988_t:CDS:1, partial [Acaulospora colombiana]